MKSAQLIKTVLPWLLVLAFALPATAAVTLYDTGGASFSTDGSFNTFYVYSDNDATNKTQARIKMGFLPNYIGFNFSKQSGELKLGGRSSFWVTINDSDDSPTATAIDVRQFYGTVDAAWGQVLFGKDFSLFNRSNIFLDEILQGFGKTAGLDASGVSFGNIGAGYTYPLPSAQITYRSPDLGGLKLAVGLLDPARTSGAGGEEGMPRLEGELTYNHTFGQAAVTAWVGFLTQKSKGSLGDIDSRGISYGLQGKLAGVSLTASGYTGSGLNTALGAFGSPTDGLDSNGLLLQGSYTLNQLRVVASYGKTEEDTAVKSEDEIVIGALFYSVNDNLKLVAEYNVETATSGSTEAKTNTIATGVVLNF